jgi:hypothetical protein
VAYVLRPYERSKQRPWPEALREHLVLQLFVHEAYLRLSFTRVEAIHQVSSYLWKIARTVPYLPL